MANNRLYLRCIACGDKLFLGKHYMGGFFYDNYHPENGTLEEQLNDFYDKHSWCNGYPLECFELFYEDDENYKKVKEEEK
jgi:hypothetical protein